MGISTPRARAGRAALLAVGAGLLASLAFGGTAVAAAPAQGVNCDQVDGDITGRGATFANRAQAALIGGYNVDVCGVPTAPNYFVAYNNGGVATGSGAGLNSTAWRADAWGGTDIPYSTQQRSDLNAGCGAPFAQPTGVSPSLGPWPVPCSDPTTAVMSFPIAGSAISLGINLVKARDCAPNPGVPIGTLRFTNQQASRILGGDILRWNDPALRTGGQNAGLANCDIAISRVVRQDVSGSTQILKNYLARADGLRAGATCDPTRDWAGFFDTDAQNRGWPNSLAPAPDTGVLPTVAATATCSAVVRNAANGTGALITSLNATPGGVGYADLADVAAQPALIRPELRNGTNTAFAAPRLGLNANCNFIPLGLPGDGDPAASVGLDDGDNYSFDQASNNRSNATLVGSGYPICGLTFALVWTGLSDTDEATPDPISRLTDNQRRTLYSYFTYVLSPLGQSRLQNINYTPLPSRFVDSIRSGFQGNF